MKAMEEMILTLHEAIIVEKKKNMAEDVESIEFCLRQVLGALDDINDKLN